MKTLIVTTCCTAFLVSCVAGCAVFPWMSKTTTDLVLASAEQPVDRILCIWQPAEGRGMDNLPTRGFGGQIFFFTRGVATPVVGNGEVDVFLFDDQGKPEEQAKPLHKFEFTEEAWNSLLRKTQMGPAYSLFVPYVRKGRHHAQCSLVVRLRPRDGMPTSSNMVYVSLRGPKEDHTKNGSKTQENDNRSHATETHAVTLPETVVTRRNAMQQPARSTNVTNPESPAQLEKLQETPALKQFRLAPPDEQGPANGESIPPESGSAFHSHSQDLSATIVNRPRAL